MLEKEAKKHYIISMQHSGKERGNPGRTKAKSRGTDTTEGRKKGTDTVKEKAPVNKRGFEGLLLLRSPA